MRQDRINIFYADDDKDDIIFFEDALEEAGPTVDLVTQYDGSELLRLLNNPPPSPSMVFLDWNMPGVNGASVLKSIRANDRTSNIPVIIISTSDYKENIEHARALGANLYVTKPNSFNALVQMLKDCLAIDWKAFDPKKENFIYSFEQT
jgi:CheY-like chemotaxis protein